MKKIDIGEDFSDTPLGRYPSDNAYNGTVFREKHLIPALNEGFVTVIIDHVEGYGSSFLEEAFGGLVRQGFTVPDLEKKLIIEFTDPDFQIFKSLIWKYINAEGNKTK